MKKFLITFSIIAISIIVLFFVLDIFLRRKNYMMPLLLRNIFALSFLFISAGMIIVIILSLLSVIKLPAGLEVNLFEFFLLALALVALSLGLLLVK